MLFPAIFAAKNQSLEYMSNIDQEHRITYKAGITRTPSDFLCQDGELAECINLTTDNEELKPIVMPAEFISAAYDGSTAIDMPKFLYIHKYNDKDRYIGVRTIVENNTDVQVIYWGELEDSNSTKVYKDKGALTYGSSQKIYYTDKVKITSIGKTLIIAEESGMHYFNWKSSSYATIVYPIPDLQFEAKLVGQDATWFAVHSGKADGMLSAYYDLSTGVGTVSIRPESSQEDYNELVTGLYLENIKAIAEEKCFAKPFFIRAALELKDGTYTNITPPILLFPAIEENTNFYLYQDTNLSADVKGVICATQKLHLYIKQSKSFIEYSDLIKDVVLFASNGIDLYDLNVDQPKTVTSNYDTDHGTYVLDKTVGYDIRSIGPDDVGRLSASVHSTTEFTPPEISGFICHFSFRGLQRRESKSINGDIESTSIFYKIASIGLDAITGWTDLATKTTSEVTRNLTTQERLEEDDYYSRNALVPQFLYAYNSRLNLANVSRALFEGAGFFMPLDDNSTPPNDYHYYYFDVTVKTDDNDEAKVRHIEYTNQKQGLYFYYPDSRATHVKIYKAGTSNKLILDADLKEHPGLNGAYYFSGVTPSTDEPAGTDLQGNIPDVTISDPEKLPNYIISSEVNNPFVFPKSGYNKVGTGKILAISTTTMALSQDQFGKTDLIVFSESGIWGMQVDGTGLFSAIHPITRDVIINPHNLIQTDGAVFFVTKKGLMVISQDGVRCLSELMNGKPFNATTLSGLTPQEIQGESNPAHPWYQVLRQTIDSSSFLTYLCSEYCKISYDYIDSRLFMINQQKGYNFMLNLKDGTISKSLLPFALTNVVNNYPDYLLQSNEVRTDDEKQGKVYSFYNKPREEDVTTRNLYSFLLTRPMKLAGPVSKASLRQLKNVGFWDEGTQQTPLSLVKTVIYLSDDLKTWYLDSSRFGTAAKYYRLALFIKMLPSERLSGTIITSQERRTNNFR